MGIFSGIDALRKVQKMKQGGVYQLSAAQISCMLVNLPDAKKRLDAEQFACVDQLYQLYQKKTDMRYYNYAQYLEKAVDMVARFNVFAPYNRYSGGGNAETLLLVRELDKFDGDGMIEAYRAKHEELEQLEDMLSQLEKLLQEAKQTISNCIPKTEILRLVARGELEKTVLDAYEAQEQSVIGTPSMIETTKQRISQTREEMDNILTG